MTADEENQLTMQKLLIGIVNQQIRKLAEIKEIRLEKLINRNRLSCFNSDVTMPDNIKTWRQSLRDLPQNVHN